MADIISVRPENPMEVRVVLFETIKYRSKIANLFHLKILVSFKKTGIFLCEKLKFQDSSCKRRKNMLEYKMARSGFLPICVIL